MATSSPIVGTPPQHHLISAAALFEAGNERPGVAVGAFGVTPGRCSRPVKDRATSLSHDSYQGISATAFAICPVVSQRPPAATSVAPARPTHRRAQREAR
jgi:hypothetical protein